MSDLKTAFAAELGLPRNEEGPVFGEPWEAQAFALAVALHDAKLFAWSEWTTALSREIAASQGGARDSYYRCWLAALERLVAEKGAASRSALGVRQEAWARAADATPHGQPIRLENDPEWGLADRAGRREQGAHGDANPGR